MRRKRRTKQSPRARHPKPVKKRAVGKRRRIGMFGGTFDPIHFGHMNAIETVLRDLKLDEVWVVPAAQNPLREKVEGPSPQERLEMVSLALDDLNQGMDVYRVCADEIERGGISYTVDTLTAFQKKDKTAEFFLILGADHIESFSKWKDFKKILRLANIVFTTRPGTEIPTDKESAPEWLAQEVKSFKGAKLKMRSGKSLYFVGLNDVDVSSTEIRRKSRRGGAISHMTPSVVEKFILRNKLYHRTDTKISDYVEFTKFCAKTLADKGALEIRAYDISNLVQPAEYTVVASGTSTRHAKALADHVTRIAKEEFGIFPLGVEGLQEGRWVVLDYGALMVHVFYDFVRSEYRIEELWSRGNSVL